MIIRFEQMSWKRSNSDTDKSTVDQIKDLLCKQTVLISEQRLKSLSYHLIKRLVDLLLSADPLGDRECSLHVE